MRLVLGLPGLRLTCSPEKTEPDKLRASVNRPEGENMDVSGDPLTCRIGGWFDVPCSSVAWLLDVGAGGIGVDSVRFIETPDGPLPYWVELTSTGWMAYFGIPVIMLDETSLINSFVAGNQKQKSTPLCIGATCQVFDPEYYLWG